MYRHLAMLHGVALAAMITMAGVAQAEVVSSPARALQLLTEARVASEKCGWLTPNERRELTDYAARAELEAVRREGAAATKAAVKKGKEKGSAGCTAEKKELVTAVLRGAREAMQRKRTARAQASSQVGRPARRMADTTRARQRPTARSAPVRPVARVQRVSWSGPVARIERTGGNDLRRYRTLAATYYHALKCRNRPQAELLRMWRTVRNLHFAILGSGRKEALARAKAQARRTGQERGCR